MAKSDTLRDILYNMKRGCYNENDITYHSFGAKGIKICDEWLNDSKAFYAWCRENGWVPGKKVTRKDKTKDFCPDNCVVVDKQSKKYKKLKQTDLAQTFLGINLQDHPIASKYAGMKSRCYNPKDPRYKTYGARGITVCNDWLGKYGLLKFFIWSMENGWENGLTIDRIDNDRGYSPDNCRWTTMEVQLKNRRQVKLYYYDGDYRTIPEISRRTGVSEYRLRKLIQEENKSVEESLIILRENCQIPGA
jgi:hypothetical protein